MNNILIYYEDLLNEYKSKEIGERTILKYKTWFPIKESTTLSGIIADIICDGHLQDQPKLRVDYCSKYTNELKRFNSEIYSLFSINGKIRPCSTNKYSTYLLGINNKPLGRILKKLGVPTGAKVNKSFLIPNWIVENKDYFRKFINRVICCEGSIDINYPAIDLSMYKNYHLINNGIEFFNQIKVGLFIHFNIITSNPFLINNKNCKTTGIRIKIRRKESIIKFYENITLDDTKKQEKLTKLIKINNKKLPIQDPHR